MTEKNQPKTGSERARAYRERLKAQGARQISVTLSKAALERLRELSKAHKKAQGEILAEALFAWSPVTTHRNVRSDDVRDEEPQELSPDSHSNVTTERFEGLQRNVEDFTERLEALEVANRAQAEKTEELTRKVGRAVELAQSAQEMAEQAVRHDEVVALAERVEQAENQALDKATEVIELLEKSAHRDEMASLTDRVAALESAPPVPVKRSQKATKGAERRTVDATTIYIVRTLKEALEAKGARGVYQPIADTLAKMGVDTPTGRHWTKANLSVAWGRWNQDAKPEGEELARADALLREHAGNLLD